MVWLESPAMPFKIVGKACYFQCNLMLKRLYVNGFGVLCAKIYILGHFSAANYSPMNG